MGINFAYLKCPFSLTPLIYITMKRNKNPYRRPQRWLTLLAILASAAFYYVYPIINDSPGVVEVTDSYVTFLTPASFTFSVWTFIYFALIMYGVMQLIPSQQRYSIYNKLNGPTTWVSLLGALRVVLYTDNDMGLSFVGLCLMLVCSSLLFARSHKVIVHKNNNLWLQVPFALLAGWLAVAVPINALIYFKYLGWTMNITEEILSLILILLVTFTGYLVSFKTSSFVYPFTIAWGLFGIGVARENNISNIPNVAMVCAWLLIIIPVSIAAFRKIKMSKKIKTEIKT
jgi:benzodiazapine receptor